jgi:hypothetical protein
MPQTSIVAGIPATWSLDVQWPYRYQQGAGADIGETVLVSKGAPFLTGTLPSNVGRQLRSFTQAGGGVTMASGYYNGIWSKSVVTVGAVPLDIWGWLPLFPAIGAAASFAPGTLTPAHMRCVWIQVTLAMAAGAVWTTASGVAVLNSSAPIGAQRWPGAGAQPNFGGFGVFGTGVADQLQFIAYDGTTPGPAGVLTAVAIPAPAAPGAWRSFDFVITGGAPSRDSTLDVYVGGGILTGASQLRFTNAPGGCFFDPVGIANAMMQLAWRLGDVGAGNGMRLGGWRIRTGSYTRDGVELRD